MKEEKDGNLTGEKKIAEALDGHHFLGLGIDSTEKSDSAVDNTSDSAVDKTSDSAVYKTSDSAVDKTSMPIVKGKALIGKYITRTSTLLCVY